MEGPKSNMTDVITGREKFTHRDTDAWGEMPHNNRDWNDARTRQGAPRFASNHKQLGRGKEGSPRPEPSEGCPDTLILNFWPLEQCKNKLLLF